MQLQISFYPARLLRAAQNLGGLLPGPRGPFGEDLPDALGLGFQLRAAAAGFGEVALGQVIQGLFDLAVAEAAAAILGGHLLPLGGGGK